MWDRDPRIPQHVYSHFLRGGQVCVGDNEPYSGRHPHDFTIDHHAESRGLPHAGFEIRQDLVADRGGAREWAGIMADALRGILDDETLYCRLPEQAESPVFLSTD
jgi:predicted N-formylglutamate amidohydrolase